MTNSAVLLAAIALLGAACAMAPATAGSASIAGAIDIGNESAPALRVCATPLGDGASRCIDTAFGAGSYRIDGLAAGRYHVMGWVQDGELRLVAHAQIIRCVRAPCPPDTLTTVEVGDGAKVHGIDLTAPYTDIPAGWPRQPSR